MLVSTLWDIVVLYSLSNKEGRMDELRDIRTTGPEDVLNSVDPYRYTSQIPNGKSNNLSLIHI